MATPGGGTLIPFRLTQSDLASLVGASRPQVNKALGQYQDRGYLATDRQHRTTILNPNALAEYCQ